jgi:hypothetical protein
MDIRFLKQYFQMKNKNYTDVKPEEVLHDVTDKLDYILGSQEPEEIEEQLWQWLLVDLLALRLAKSTYFLGWKSGCPHCHNTNAY